jgi:mannose-6-phosphate isomerase-like protein (cupin superfamily)
MDLQTYISSGIIEDYCLGLLSAEEKSHLEQLAAQHPEIQEAINGYRITLEAYAAEQAVAPNNPLKDKILGLVDNLAKEANFDQQNLPVVNHFSDRGKWMEFARPLIPAGLKNETFMFPLRDEAGVEQYAVWTDLDIPDEDHDDLIESFFVLEGICDCYVGDKMYRLGPGDFLEIPLYTSHNVQLINSVPVIAILQRLKVA